MINNKYPKIKFICAFFGEWPPWFDAFLISCKYNTDIEWLFFTDKAPPKNFPSNISFINGDLNKFSELATQKLNLKVKVTKPYKICDFKLSYGLIFEDYLKTYDFWGMCDIDVIFGNIKKIITNDMLMHNDIISSRKELIAGHFTLFKNCRRINNLFKEMNHHKKVLESDQKIGNFVEAEITEHLKKHKYKYKIKWDQWLVNFPQEMPIEAFYDCNGNLPSKLDKSSSTICAREGAWLMIKPLPNCNWEWRKGNLFVNDKEILYLHFKNWKGTLKNINFNYEDDVDSFNINHVRINKS